eukprot:6118766-Amphidinium_carterae.2
MEAAQVRGSSCFSRLALLALMCLVGIAGAGSTRRVCMFWGVETVSPGKFPMSTNRHHGELWSLAHHANT